MFNRLYIQIRDFQLYVDEQIRVNGFLPESVVNMDETNVDFDTKTGETYDYQGAKTVNHTTTGSSMRATIILAVTKSGEKLPPFLIFKGTPGGRIHREWTKAGNTYPPGIVYTVQKKAWCDHSLMLQWITSVWQPFAANHEQSYLMYDSFKAHLMGDVIRKIQKERTEVDIIPPGYTGRLQVCDVSINKPFKDAMRDEYEKWMLVEGNDKVSRLNVATWCAAAWDAISVPTIVNGWRKCIDDVLPLPVDSRTGTRIWHRS